MKKPINIIAFKLKKPLFTWNFHNLWKFQIHFVYLWLEHTWHLLPALSPPKYEISTKQSGVVCGYVRVLSWTQHLERIILPFAKTWLSKKSYLNEKESWTVNWEKENYKRKDQSQGNCAWSWRQFNLPTLQTDRAPLLACSTEHLTQPVVYGVWQKYSHQKQDKIFSLQ